MGSSNPFKGHPPPLKNKLFTWTLYALLPIALIRLYFYPFTLPPPPSDQFPPKNSFVISSSSSSSSSPSPSSTSPSPSSPSQEEGKSHGALPCDYTNGKWFHDERGPLYNGTNCRTIKEGQNCMGHGRPDVGYLYWRWRPSQCKIPRFEPNTFLQLLKSKHVAFVGDSMARNQLESLLCMISTSSSPNLVYEDGEDNKLRRWHFPSYNVSVSIYWSPFLVKGMEKSNNGGPNFNRLYLDSVDERWASDLDKIDMLVLSVGHWFLHPAVYFDGNSVMGCHFCTGQNYTEVGFYGVFGKAINTTLKAIMERSGSPIDVILTTFSPAHFEGEWDKLGACPKQEPFKEGEKELVYMDADMRKIELDEVEMAKKNGKRFKNFRLEALDVTKLSLMRPDGHPGPYMYPFPFANGVTERVQNDCVHWCLPGPIDVWNEILLAVMKRWKRNAG